MARHGYAADALIEILHIAQKLYGHLDKPMLLKIARRLKLPPSRVLGVATFYHLFRLTPPDRHNATVCMGTACYVAGAADLLEFLDKRCKTVPNGGVKVGSGRCIGSCGLAPLVVYDGETVADVTRRKLEKLLDEAGSK